MHRANVEGLSLFSVRTPVSGAPPTILTAHPKMNSCSKFCLFAQRQNNALACFHREMQRWLVRHLFERQITIAHDLPNEAHLFAIASACGADEQMQTEAQPFVARELALHGVGDQFGGAFAVNVHDSVSLRTAKPMAFQALAQGSAGAVQQHVHVIG